MNNKNHRKLKIKAVNLIILLFCVHFFSLTAHAYGTKNYSWQEIYAGVLGDKPAINLIDGEAEFLCAKEASNDVDSNYTNADIVIGEERSFWVLTSVHNDNPKEEITANDVRLSVEVTQVTDEKSVVTASLTSSNAMPYSLSDSISFTGSESYHLEYVKGSTFVYSRPDNTQKTMKSPGDAVSSEGVLLGFEQLDGKIPGGKYVSVSIELKVVRDSDIEKLYNTKNGKATAKMWNLIQEYSDPQFFLHEYHKKMNSIYYMKKLKGKKYRKLVNVAKKQAAGCSNDYEKMQKISKYLAQSLYYDYPYFEGKSKSTNLNPYDIWKNKKTICQGYTTLYWVMLDAIDIPCMLIYSRHHVYNAAYDKNSDRWVFIDVTWCSGNRYDGKNKWTEGEYNDTYFDMSLERMLSITNHEIFNVEGVLKKKVYYELSVSKGSGPTASYTNMNKWRWNVAVKKKSNAKIVSKIAGIRVKK